MKLVLALIFSVTAITAQAQEGGIYKKESFPLKWESCVVKVHEMTKKVLLVF